MHAYNSDHNALALIHSYLSKRKQRRNINSSFSPWHDILVDVPQGFNLGPLLFNVYVNDIFYIIKDAKIANFTEGYSNKLYSCYELNWLKPNADKYHLLLSSHDENLGLLINTDKVNNSEEKLLGVTFDNDFSCITHVKICAKRQVKTTCFISLEIYYTKSV